MEVIIGKAASIPGFDKLVEEKQKQFVTSYKGGALFFEEAILELCLTFPFVAAAQYIAENIVDKILMEDALNLMTSYRNEYEIPKLITKIPEEKRYSDRIWHACMKQTIDWQTEHLIKILNLDS